jgi:SLAP domain-containing protein
MSNNKHKDFKDTIVIDKTLREDVDNVITINSDDLNHQSTDDNFNYRISEDDKAITIDLLSNLKEGYLKDKDSKEILIKDLTKYGFENIPEDLNETQLKDILEFAISKIFKDVEYGRIYPFSAKKTDNGDLEIILLMYNWNTQPLILGNVPLKLKDAENKVVFADLADLSKVISPKKIGVYYIKVDKDALKEDKMDLTTWTVTFEK